MDSEHKHPNGPISGGDVSRPRVLHKPWKTAFHHTLGHFYR